MNSRKKGMSNLKIKAMVVSIFTRGALLVSLNLVSACQLLISTKKLTNQGVALPFLKNTPNECYYLDDFMPVPNNMVTGKSGSLSLRYYTYNAASYKDWQEKQIILSFYSKDSRCWSLFEEYYVLD